ncbi:MAG: hypothetical protein ACRDF4_02445 [Rhabdochlamydiaceae bacterium]
MNEKDIEQIKETQRIIQILREEDSRMGLALQRLKEIVSKEGLAVVEDSLSRLHHTLLVEIEKRIDGLKQLSDLGIEP